MCALYSHAERLPKTATGSQGAAPGAAKVWRFPEGAPELLMCRAVFFGVLGGSCVWSDSPGRLQEPPVRGGSQSCRSWNMTPGGGPQSTGVVPSTSLVRLSKFVRMLTRQGSFLEGIFRGSDFAGQ